MWYRHMHENGLMEKNKESRYRLIKILKSDNTISAKDVGKGIAYMLLVGVINWYPWMSNIH